MITTKWRIHILQSVNVGGVENCWKPVTKYFWYNVSFAPSRVCQKLARNTSAVTQTCLRVFIPGLMLLYHWQTTQHLFQISYPQLENSWLSLRKYILGGFICTFWSIPFRLPVLFYNRSSSQFIIWKLSVQKDFSIISTSFKNLFLVVVTWKRIQLFHLSFLQYWNDMNVYHFNCCLS